MLQNLQFLELQDSRIPKSVDPANILRLITLQCRRLGSVRSSPVDQARL